MTAVAIKGSTGESMVFTQSEATAAQATWCFHLVKSADGTDATALVPVVSISKAGAAFAGAAGVVSEISGGWYKIVFTNVDLSTIGQLLVNVAVATADTLNVSHQVTLLDQNIATVPLAASAISAATFAAGAIAAAGIAAGAITATAFAADAIDTNAIAATAVTEIQAGLATTAGITALSAPLKNLTNVLGTLSTNVATPGVSMQGATTAKVTLAGVWNGATVTVQYCPNPQATVPQWINVQAGSTADAAVTVAGPVNAIRAIMSAAGGSSAVVCTAEVSYPQG